MRLRHARKETQICTSSSHSLACEHQSCVPADIVGRRSTVAAFCSFTNFRNRKPLGATHLQQLRIGFIIRALGERLTANPTRDPKAQCLRASQGYLAASQQEAKACDLGRPVPASPSASLASWPEDVWTSADRSVLAGPALGKGPLQLRPQPSALLLQLHPCKPCRPFPLLCLQTLGPAREEAAASILSSREVANPALKRSRSS